MSLHTAFHAVNRALNPFYRNPIVELADYDHLNGDRIVMPNPHTAVWSLGQTLMSQPKVIEALKELSGHVVLIVAVTPEGLKINVYPIATLPSNEQLIQGYAPLNTVGWPTEGLYYYVIDEVISGSKRAYAPLLAQSYHPLIQIDRMAPEQSWTVPLSYADRVLLGLARA